MTIQIPEEKLAEIRSAADIVDIVSERVALKKAGKDYTGLCPFHSEKTPSFTVSQTKQIFYCFGCGAGGDVFDFLMKSDGVSFPEAVQSIARRCGIQLPHRRMSPSEKRAISEREKLFEINRKALGFFRDQLLRQPAGERARAYIQKRGFSGDIVKRFGLGYAPDGWDNLLRFLRKERIPAELAEKAGLVVSRSSGSGHYDRFRNRIILPIVDAARQVVAFGGRVLDEGTPKYLNSPETPVYTKSRSLYGLHAARDACRDEGAVYIVEGYFDLLALHQHGIQNSVATLGTSLTAAHVRMIRRGFAPKARLVFDSDAAGIKAALRSIGLFLNEAVEVEIIVLPEGEDPDSFLFGRGPEAFFEHAQNAKGGVEFLVDQAVNAHGLSMQGKIRVVDELKQPLADIRDHVARSVYIRHLAERLDIDEQAILEQVRSARSEKKGGLRPGEAAAGRPAGRAGNGPEISENRLECRLIAMMLHSPSILPDVERKGIVDYFESSRLRELAELILSRPPEAQADISGLLNRIAEDDQRRLVAHLAMNEEKWERKGCEKLMEQFLSTRRRRQQELIDEIRAAEAENDHERVFQLLKEKQKQVVKSG